MNSTESDPDELFFDGRVALQDLVMPLYRRPIYEMLGARIKGGFGVFTGVSKLSRTRGVVMSEELDVTEHATPPNHHFGYGAFEMVWQPGLSKWLNGFRPDVLIAAANPRTLSTNLGCRWAQKNGVPVLGWGLGSLMLAKGAEGLRHYGRKRFYGKFDGMIAYSTIAKEQYAGYGVPPERIFIVHNATTPRPTQPAPIRPDTFTERPRILFVGRLYEGKRLELLFEALSQMPKETRPVLEVVGTGPGTEEIKQQAEATLPGEVIFSGGLYGEDLAEAFKRADLFVLPGLGGLAIQEAMSWALPVIAAEGDGTQFDLVRKENGWLMEPGSVSSLRDCLEDAFSDCQRLRRFGLEGYRIVDEELNRERMIDEFVIAIKAIHELKK